MKEAHDSVSLSSWAKLVEKHSGKMAAEKRAEEKMREAVPPPAPPPATDRDIKERDEVKKGRDQMEKQWYEKSNQSCQSLLSPQEESKKEEKKKRRIKYGWYKVTYFDALIVSFCVK